MPPAANGIIASHSERSSAPAARIAVTMTILPSPSVPARLIEPKNTAVIETHGRNAPTAIAKAAAKATPRATLLRSDEPVTGPSDVSRRFDRLISHLSFTYAQSGFGLGSPEESSGGEVGCVLVTRTSAVLLIKPVVASCSLCQ